MYACYVMQISSKTIALSALMATLTFIVTFSIRIPTPVRGGYLNIGDSVIFLSALIYGPLVGFLAGSIGSALSDVAAGSIVFVPGTFFIKGIEGALVGLLYKYYKNKPFYISSITLIVGLTIIFFSLLGYTTGFWKNIEAFYCSEDFCITESFSIISTFSAGTIFLIISFLSFFSMKFKNAIFQDFLIVSILILGGMEMVFGYFIYEIYLFGGIAFAEVPFNIVQASSSIIIAFFIFKSLKYILKL